MRVLQDVLSLALLGSGLLGLQVLVNDRWLWSAAPSHAYGLVGFVALDLFLTVAVWIRRNAALLGATLVSGIQLGAMATDLLIGQPTGVPSAAFRSYLLSDAPYVGLLIAQAVIMLVAMGAIAVPMVTKQVHWHPRLFAHR